MEFIAGHPGTPVPRCTAQVRYDHFGDLSTLLPDGAPLRIAGPEDIDFTSVPDPGAYPLSVTGQVQAGRLRLDWWCSPALRQRLVSAGVPGRVVNLLSTVDGAR